MSCMPAGVGSKVNDIWLLVSMALLGVILKQIWSTTSFTDSRKQGSEHVLELDAHLSGNLFIFVRICSKRR